MAFDANFTYSVFGTDDAEFKLVKVNGQESRVAVLADGGEITMTISHEAKKRERHVVKWTYQGPATATTPAPAPISHHHVIDQALPPESQEAKTTSLGVAFNAWLTANYARVQRGEV